MDPGWTRWSTGDLSGDPLVTHPAPGGDAVPRIGFPDYAIICPAIAAGLQTPPAFRQNERTGGTRESMRGKRQSFFSKKEVRWFAMELRDVG